MQIDKLDKQDRRLINSEVMAEKYEVSPAYVRMILSGERKSNSKKAEEILAEAKRIIKAIKG